MGCFHTSSFYPGFILWVKDGNCQRVVFVEPHGMRNNDAPPYNDKVELYVALRDLSDRMSQREGPKGVCLDSYIVSATPFHELRKRWNGVWTREDFAVKHVLFGDDPNAKMPLLVEGDR